MAFPGYEARMAFPGYECRMGFPRPLSGYFKVFLIRTAFAHNQRF